MCVCASLSQDGIPVKKPIGRLTSPTMVVPSPFLTFKELYSREGLLDFENEKCVVSIFYLGRVQLLRLPLWSICPQEMNYGCSVWGPSISCLNMSRSDGTLPLVWGLNLLVYSHWCLWLQAAQQSFQAAALAQPIPLVMRDLIKEQRQTSFLLSPLLLSYSQPHHLSK